MIDWKQERTQAAMRNAGWFGRKAIELFGVSTPADYRAENVADFLKGRKQMDFGQTVRFPDLVLENFRPSEEDTSLYDVRLRDETGELIVKAFPKNHNYDMCEPLALSIAQVGRGGRIHLPVLVNGSNAIYTPLSQDYPLCLLSFTRDITAEPRIRREFELRPIERFGDMASE